MSSSENDRCNSRAKHTKRRDPEDDGICVDSRSSPLDFRISSNIVVGSFGLSKSSYHIYRIHNLFFCITYFPIVRCVSLLVVARDIHRIYVCEYPLCAEAAWKWHARLAINRRSMSRDRDYRRTSARFLFFSSSYLKCYLHKSIYSCAMSSC